MSVEENILMGAYTRADGDGMSKSLEWVYNLFPRLKERRTQQAGTLSGGEQQMCAIARGLMADPKLLLSGRALPRPRPGDGGPDGGCGPGDPRTGRISILLVEQDVQTAFELSSRGYILETGTIVAEEASQTLLGDNRIREAYLGI